MITSNIHSILASLNHTKNNEIHNSEESFQNTLMVNLEEPTRTKTNSLTYDNIKGITLEEIDTLFTNENDKNMAKNLRIATLFTNDDYLAKVLFNTVLGQPFNLGYSYLSDRYNDKSIFFSSKNSNNLFDLLEESISQKLNNSTKSSTNVISQDKIDEILTKVNSFNFISALSNSSKKGYDKYKNEKNDYSFLYNDYNLKYQELMYKYKELENLNKNIIKQF